VGFSGNFTQATLTGDTLTVRGGSRAPADTIVDIRVGIEVGVGAEPARVEFGPVAMVGETWVARFPVKGRDAAADFEVGQQVLAFGVETRCGPLRTDTWAQMLTIDAES
jgi:hypothetical protein